MLHITQGDTQETRIHFVQFKTSPVLVINHVSTGCQPGSDLSKT